MTIGSILIGSCDTERLRRWYQRMLDAPVNPDGFLEFDQLSILIDRRDDVGAEASEPGRHIINFHVDDIHQAVGRVREAQATRSGEVELRDGVWFATFCDPDGNLIQLIQLTSQYWAARGRATEVARATVGARLPATDLVRAEEFYGSALGLFPAERRPGGLRYQAPSGSFSLFSSSGRASGEHTQLTFTVNDIELAAAELRRHGVAIHDIDEPGLQTVNGIGRVHGTYPSSRADGELAAWFNDSEGNLLSISQPIRRGAVRSPA